jgi:hypothetical protein
MAADAINNEVTYELIDETTGNMLADGYLQDNLLVLDMQFLNNQTTYTFNIYYEDQETSRSLVNIYKIYY